MDSEFCVNCGSKFQINQKFCGKCGNKREQIELEDRKETLRKFDDSIRSPRGSLPSQNDMTSRGTCPDCQTELEFKGRNLFSKCVNCGKSFHLEGEEWDKYEKYVKRKIYGRTVGSIIGMIFGIFICVIGFAIMIGVMSMPMIIAGQYLILALIIIIGGIVVAFLSSRRMNDHKLDEWWKRYEKEYERETGYSGDYKKFYK